MSVNIVMTMRNRSLGSIKTTIGELCIFDFTVNALSEFTSCKKDDLRKIIPHFCFPKESLIDGKYKPDKPFLSSENALQLNHDDLESISQFCIKYFKFLHFQDLLPDKLEGENFQDCLKRKLNGSFERLLSVRRLSISETSYLNDALNKLSISFQNRLAKPLQESINKIHNLLSENGSSHKVELEEAIRKMLIPIDNLSKSFDKSFLLLKHRILPTKELNKMKSAMGDYTLSYRDLAVSLKTPEDITKLPTFAFQNATQEFLLTVYAFETLSKPQEERAITGIVPPYIDMSLRAIDPLLADMRIGAYDDLRSHDPDRKRHALDSSRALFDGLLNRLAPVKEAHAGNSHKDEKSPLRKAQIEFLCQKIKNKHYRKFVEYDTEAIMKMWECFDLLQGAGPELPLEPTWALLLRLDSWIISIINIWKTNSKVNN